MTLIHDTLTTYGVGSGNAPALITERRTPNGGFSFNPKSVYEQFNLYPSSGY